MVRKSKRSVKKSRRTSWKRPAREYSKKPSRKTSSKKWRTEDDRADLARKSRKSGAKKSATKRSASSVLRAGRIKRAQNLAQKAIDEGQSVASAINKYILPMADRECDTEWEAERLISKCKSALNRGTTSRTKGTIKAKKQKLSVAAILIKEVIPKAKSIGVSPKKLKEIEKILRDASERKATRSSRRREEY